MTTQTEALRMALEALEGWGKGFPDNWGDLDTEAVTAIKEALALSESSTKCEEASHAQPEQEQAPVAWRYDLKRGGSFAGVFTEYSPVKLSIGENWTPLYTTPPQREVEQAMRLYKAVERLSLQAGEETDEAIDWLCGEHGGMFKLYEAYFSPKSPQREWKGLTDEEIIDLWDGHVVPVFGKNGINPIVFARAIEAAHGIKGDA